MAKMWPKLSKPPVEVALFQLKFEMGNTALSDFLKCDSQLSKYFPSNPQLSSSASFLRLNVLSSLN